jgi:hypothetical protein
MNNNSSISSFSFFCILAEGEFEIIDFDFTSKLISDEFVYCSLRQIQNAVTDEAEAEQRASYDIRFANSSMTLIVMLAIRPIISKP